MRIFVLLLVYCFVSPYNFYWFLFNKQTHDLDHYQLVTEVFQPITQLAGIFFAAYVMAMLLNYKFVLISFILYNLVTTLITELAYVLDAPVMFEICYFLQGFGIGGLRLCIYEMVTEVTYPVVPTMALTVLHASANTIILAFTCVSDEISAKFAADTTQNNLFNDIVQLIFVVGLVICGQRIIKYGVNDKRTTADNIKPMVLYNTAPTSTAF